MTYRRKEVIGPHTLYLADCKTLLPTLGKVDAVVTDPPYGIDVGSMNMGAGAKASGFDRFQWDERTFPDELQMALSLAVRSIVWGGNYYDLPPSRGYLVWDKIQEFSGADSEIAWCSWAQVPRTFRYARAQLASETKHHPTQKPLPLMRWCLEFIPGSRTILDPFMGSGTTIVACQKLGRIGIGIEIEEKYFDIACKRVEEAMKQPDLFVTTPSLPPVQEVLL